MKPIRIKSLRAPRKAPNKQPELAICKAFYKHFCLKYPKFENRIIRFEHGGFKLSWGGTRAWANVGIKKGIPDYGFFHEVGKYKMLWIEFKAPGNKLSPEQMIMRDLFVKWGAKHVTCWSEEQGMEAIADYLMDEYRW